jgi:hypothetical protein
MSLEIISYGIEFAIQTAFLVVALWIMIKLQKLNYKFLPLLGAAALASGLDMIPYAGHYLAVPALLYCVWKVTEAEMVPDVVFTVVISYALMFGMNLWLLGSMMGDLRPSALDGKNAGGLPPEAAAAVEDTAPTNPPAALVQPTNPAPVKPEAVAATPPSQTNVAAPPRPAQEYVNQLSLKGLVRSSTRPMATIQSGTRTYTIGVRETVFVEMGSEKVAVRCVEVEENSVILNLAGENVRLSFR